MHEKSVLRDAFFRKQKTEDRGQKRAKRGALRGTMPRERKRRSAAVPAARFPAAVSLSPDRGFSFFRAKEREKSAEKRKKAPGFGYGESAVLFRLPRQSASTHNADGSALHLPQPCLVSNPADVSQKIHAPAKCCARPCGFGNVMVVPIVLLANAYKHSAPADP